MNRVAQILLLLFCTLGLSSAFAESWLDENLDFEEAIKFNQVVAGKTVNRVEIEGTAPGDRNPSEMLQELKGKPLRLHELREIVRWFSDGSRDASLEIEALPVAAGVNLRVQIRSKIKISSIRFTGLSVFDDTELLDIGQISAGDDLDTSSVDAAARKILDYYRNAGYLQAAIVPKIEGGGVLVLNISEGGAAIIRDISISSMEGVGDIKIRRILEQSAIEAFGVRVGERLDRRQVRDGMTKLKDWLKSRDFLIAREPVVNTIIFDGGGSARIDISVAYGPRIRFGFRNNQRFSFKELSTIAAEVQEVGIGADYLDVVRAKIYDSYFDVGLVNVKIDTEIREDPEKGYRFVSFIINEANRVRIESISIEGIYAIPKEQAIEMLLKHAPPLVRRYFFQDKGIRSAGELLSEDLRAMGYLSARLDLVKYRFNEKRDQVDVDLFFLEGVQTTINRISVNGARTLTADEIREILEIKEGAPFNVFAFEKGLIALRERYLNMGYLMMDVTNQTRDNIVRYSQDQALADITVDVVEGPLIRVGDIVVRGNKQTHARVVSRELPFIKGDVLTKGHQIEAEENLRRLNLFSSVILRPVERPGAPEIRDIIILVEEGVPGLVEFGPGFRNDLGLRFFAGASYQNLGGWHRGVTARTVINRRIENYKFFEYNINLGFREPYFAGWRVTLFTNIFFLRRNFSSFDATISKVTTEFRRELSKRFTGLLQYSFEQVKTFNAKVSRDDQKRLIGSLTPGIIYDSRDDVFNPTLGLFSINRFELAASTFGSQSDVGYYRATSNNSAYFGLADDVVLGMAVNFGFERSNIAGKEIPKIKLFRLGGTGSIRGYREEALEVDSTTVVNGTLSLVNYRSELRFPLEGDLGGALFWDAGNLYIDKIQPFDLRHAAGVGLRYRTPVGPVSLDYARKVGGTGSRGDGVNTEDRDTQRIHFSIGTF